MNQLITEISVSLLIAFLLGCFFAWLWRGMRIKRRIADAERVVEQRNQYEIATLRGDLDAAQDELDLQREELAQQTLELEEYAQSDERDHNASELHEARGKLASLDERYSALHARWERERTQFAQLVIHKNNRIAELERKSSGSEQAVIEDGTAVDSDDDNSSYSRQQLETMLVELRAQVSNQESELESLRAKTSEHSTPESSGRSGLGFYGTSDASVQEALAAKDQQIASLSSALNTDYARTRLAQVERERAELLQRVSALSSQRADDAEHTADLHREIEAVRSDLAAAEKNLQDAETRAEQIPALETRCKQLSDDVTTLQSLLDAASAERDAAKLDALPLHGMTDIEAEDTTNLGQLRSERRSLQNELRTLNTSLHAAQREASEREQQLQRATAELDELRPLQHQLTNLRSSLSELIERDERGEHNTTVNTELEQLRTRVAQVQADSKLNLERKESYYQGLLREKAALIAELQQQVPSSETEA
ncbi:MAG: hypothetical protein AAF499_10865 [Pseudomonadota bacterium]